MSIAIVKTFFEYWHSGNIEKLGDIFHDDAVVEYKGGEPYGRLLKGAGEIRKFFSNVVESTRKSGVDIDMEVCEAIESQSVVAVQSRIRISHPDKGWVFDSPAGTFFDISNGKIHRMTVYVPNPVRAIVGRMDLSKELSVEDMGKLGVVAWVVA